MKKRGAVILVHTLIQLAGFCLLGWFFRVVNSPKPMEISTFTPQPEENNASFSNQISLDVFGWRKGANTNGHDVLISVINNFSHKIIVRRPIGGLTIDLHSIDLDSGRNLPPIPNATIAYEQARLFMSIGPFSVSPYEPVSLEGLIGQGRKDGLYLCAIQYVASLQDVAAPSKSIDVEAASNLFLLRIRGGAITELSLLERPEALNRNSAVTGILDLRRGRKVGRRLKRSRRFQTSILDQVTYVTQNSKSLEDLSPRRTTLIWDGDDYLGAKS